MAVAISHCLVPVCESDCLTPLQVRTATTAEPVAHAITELEALLRPAVFASSWGSQAQPRPAGAPARKGLPGRKPTPKPGKALAVGASKSGRLNRAASTASGKPVVSQRPCSLPPLAPIAGFICLECFHWVLHSSSMW